MTLFILDYTKIDLLIFMRLFCFSLYKKVNDTVGQTRVAYTVGFIPKSTASSNWLRLNERSCRCDAGKYNACNQYRAR